MEYTKKVLKHFFKPKNVGKIKNADAIGKLENDACGDIMEVYIKVGKKKDKRKEKEYIKEIKFQTLGCPAAVAASDVLCDLVKGKTLEEAEKVNEKAITKKLGGLPVIKLHCSVLGAKTLKNAIENFRIHHKSMNSDSARKSKDFRHYRKSK